MQSSDTFDNLPLELIRQIDSIARRAEREWRDGHAAQLEDYLGEVSEQAQSVLLKELLSLEAERRVRSGQRTSLAEFTERFPQHLSLVSEVLAEFADKDGGSSASNKSRLPDFPGYSIERVLGRGAMGVVYLARHQRLQRLVALKVVAAGVDPRRAMHLIRSEAEVIARLRHPNIVQVYEIGHDQDEPFLTLEYVDGPSLRDRMLGETFTAHEAATLIQLLARAIHHAHVHGVVHRDLKPANILLPRTGTDGAKISDFGLAKVLDELNDHTRSGSVLGTPKYMAPEQAEGRSREVGPAADIYALGAILFEMLTGRAPFESSSTLKLLKLISHQEATFTTEAARRVPVDLQAICLKCLEKSPVARYASAQELADDIERYLNDYPVNARRPTRWDLATKFVRRNKVLAASAMIVLSTLLFASVGISILALREAQARRDAETLAQQAIESQRRAEQLRKEERRKFYWANLLLAQQAGKAGRLEQMRQLLQQVEPSQPEDEDHRGFEWRYLQRLSNPAFRIVDPSSGSAQAVYSPDGTKICNCDMSGIIYIRDAKTYQVEKSFNSGSVILSLAYSHDGNSVAASSYDKTIRIWDCPSERMTKQFKGHEHAVRSIVFSTDDTRLYMADEVNTVMAWNLDADSIHWKYQQENLYVMEMAIDPLKPQIALASGAGDVHMLDSNTGQHLSSFHAHDYWMTGLAYSPDGSRLATSCGDRIVKIWSTSDFQRPLRTVSHGDWVTGVAYSPDGRSLATSSRDTSVKLWDAESGKELLSLFGHTNWVMGVRFSPDGSHVLSTSLDQTTRSWIPNKDWEIRSLADLDSAATALTFTADNKLVVADFTGFVRLFDLSNQTSQAFRAHGGFISAVAVTTDGKTLATAGHDGLVKLWRLSDLVQITEFKGHEQHVLAIAFSPDGRWVASGGGDHTIRIWECESGKEVHRLCPDQVTQSTVAFSPDGRYLAQGGSRTIRMWDTRDWTEHLKLEGHTAAVMHVTFSADGQRLASCSMDQTIRQWDTTSGRQINQLSGHTNVAIGSMFSKDTRRLLTWGHDRTVRLWETDTGRELLTLPHHADWVYGAAFNPSETIIASVSKDCAVKLIELGPPKP